MISSVVAAGRVEIERKIMSETVGELVSAKMGYIVDWIQDVAVD